MSNIQPYTYPLPPPTTNSLTHSERAHLLRTTNKLTRVLGTTPKLADVDIHCDVYVYEDPVHVRLPKHNRSRSGSSCSTTTSSSFHSSNSSHTHHGPSKLHRRPRTASPPPQSKCKADPDELLASYLSLLSLQPSPLPRSPSSAFNPSNVTHQSRPEIQLPLPLPAPAPAPADRHPRFVIETEHSQKRKKMERLRKRLGDEVPVGLVFPSSPLSSLSTPSTFSVNTPSSSPCIASPAYTYYDAPSEHGSGLFEDWGFGERKDGRRFGKRR